MGENDLELFINRALDVLAVDRARLGLMILRRGSTTIIELDGEDFRLGPDDRARLLGWERLVDALPRAIEKTRLDELHEAARVAWPAPWSVYTTSTALAWLEWASGGVGTPAWQGTIGRILDAAETHGDLVVKSLADPRSSMKAHLRSRRLIADIKLGRTLSYKAADHLFTTAYQIPETAGVALRGRDVVTAIAAPWIGGRDITIAHAMIDDGGTTIMVEECDLPLEPLPEAALEPVETGRIGAPWLMSIQERLALDAIDAAAHGVG